jgi:Uma2 family endonuclease
MATATQTERDPQTEIARTPPIEFADDEPSSAFFMPAGSMSLKQFRRWTYMDKFPKTGSIAYINKEIFIDMSPERLQSHGSVKTAVSGTVIPLVFKKNKGKIFFDRTRVVNVEADVSNEPNGVMVLFETLKAIVARLVPTKDEDDYIEIEGTPDWILEIVSRSSVTKDKKKLRACYHRAGIGEYWLIDARGDDVDFQILVHGEDDYEPAKRTGNWQVSPVFGKKFRLRRIIDEVGDIGYRLDAK